MSQAAAFEKDHVSPGLTTKIAICFLALTGALLCIADNFLDCIPSAHAQNRLTAPTGTDKSATTSVPSKREAWMDATEYSRAHHVVTFVVNGRTPDATNSQIAEFIKGRFAEKGVSTKYFTGREDHIGVSLGFYIEGHAYGPVGLPKMRATIDEVAGHAKGVEYLRESGQPVP
ncbi:MAG: hypothetical protein MRJ68_09235 [Nitrospira sp.]|nr:hypothetical protein [Nitrospira sp.]